MGNIRQSLIKCILHIFIEKSVKISIPPLLRQTVFLDYPFLVAMVRLVGITK